MKLQELLQHLNDLILKGEVKPDDNVWVNVYEQVEITREGKGAVIIDPLREEVKIFPQ